MNAVASTVGETTITGKNQVSLPAQGVRHLGWERGDRLIVQVLGEDTMVLRRRPANWAEAYAGKLGHVFGTHQDTLRFLEQERAGWEAEPTGTGATGATDATPAPPNEHPAAER
jgi:bifunctional DNA-binding transcriptional regulator/antitoxin component of YhaV-PrlF toxin-antitoxin module